MSATAAPSIRFWDRVTETSVDVPVSALDLDGFRAWALSDAFPRQGRISFLAGEIHVDMSPEEIQTHNKCKVALHVGWDKLLEEDPVGEVIGDGVLLLSDDADLGTEPDGLLCLYESLRAGRVEYREVVEGSDRFVEVRGAADVTAEIVSRSSVQKDTVALVDLYYRAGVSEYWLIDARHAEIEFKIYVRGRTSFELAAADADGYRPSGVLGKSFRMTRRRNPVGGWRYKLEWR